MVIVAKSGEAVMIVGFRPDFPELSVDSEGGV